ncbi:MAG: hypothetical protein QM679_05585 [Patulibacter sp.]
MTQLSRPMQMVLAAVLVFAALWFVVLQPKDEAVEPAAATPVATAPPVAAGGATAQTGMGKAIESANNAAQNAGQAGDAAASLDPEDATTPTSPASAASGSASQPAGAAATGSADRSTGSGDHEAKRSKQQRIADALTRQVASDLKAGKAVVLLIANSTSPEDRIMRVRVTSQIARRGGNVRVYVIPAGKVGSYEGLLGTLNIASTPATVVIAPDHEAKVLPGIASVVRIDRLTSAAVQAEPAATTP